MALAIVYLHPHLDSINYQSAGNKKKGGPRLAGNARLNIHSRTRTNAFGMKAVLFSLTVMRGLVDTAVDLCSQDMAAESESGGQD